MSLPLQPFLILFLAFASTPVRSAPNEACKPERLSAYRVTVQTYWSREKFPKHYPDWRPTAQFTKILGRTHNANYVLWRLGTLASQGVKEFTEVGRSDLLDNDTQGRGGVLDEFAVPAIGKGVGRSETVFFADGNHSKVSLMSRIVPSPDWFIGIDSFDLCVLGKWVDVVTLELDPTDAGTDAGYTFTAPNWESQPQEKIYRITSLFPSHPANSFYYPHMKKLPVIATVTFVKMREYDLSQTFSSDGQQLESRYDAADGIGNTVEPYKPVRPTRRPYSTSIPYSKRYTMAAPGQKPGDVAGRDPTVLSTNDISPISRKRPPSPRHAQRGPRNCKVSDWSDWSECSRTCGIGEKRRTRTVQKRARRGGTPCPSLMETSWCGSARCTNSSTPYFDW